MATPSNLIGLGLGAQVSRRIGMNIAAVTVAGTTAGEATQLPGYPGIYYFTTGTSGVKLPTPGGQGAGAGALAGDEFSLVNATAAAIVIFAANNSKGSVVTLIGNGGAITGTTGTSLLANSIAVFKLLNISTWLYVKSSV